MAHLTQGYMHAHSVYGAAIANQPQKDKTSNEQQEAYRKAIKSIQGTLEKPEEFYETFVIKEILKIGSAYQSLRSAINKWSHLKNRLKANAKNKELGIYVTVLQQSKMYQTLNKLLSPTVGHTKSIQAAACKTLSLIVLRPNRYRNAEWYHKKQKIVALKPFTIKGSTYTVLLLISHILNGFSLKLDNLDLICYALQLLANLVNHNSDVILAINKQFTFISMIFEILNHDLFFQLTLKKEDKKNKVAILTLINALNAILNLSQHNETNRVQFCGLNGWQIICKCLKHKCMQIRQLSLCFISSICVSSKLSAKSFLNTTFEHVESFKILLDIMENICAVIDDEINLKSVDELLCKLMCSLTCLCNDNSLGYRKFCMHKSWQIIRKLLQSINSLTQKHSFSHTLHLQIFSLLSCFNVPSSFNKWKECEWNVMFKNESAEKKKKLTMKQRKLKQKKDEIAAENEYKKTQRICKEIIGMLGGYMDEGEDGDIVLKYLFKSLSVSQYVIGAMSALGILCKYKHNGNIIRLNQIIEIVKRENAEKYNLSLKGLKDKMLGSFINIKCQFMGNKDFNQLVYFISAINDLIEAISFSNDNNNNNNGKEVRDLLLKSNVIYVFCMVITKSSNKFFIHQRNNNKMIDYKARFEQIQNLKMKACYGLAKVIKYDIEMQSLFGQWLKSMNAALKDLAMDPVDNSLLQMAITHVIAAGCFKPINNQNIAQLRSQNIQHLLFQLYRQIQITTTQR